MAQGVVPMTAARMRSATAMRAKAIIRTADLSPILVEIRAEVPQVCGR